MSYKIFLGECVKQPSFKPKSCKYYICAMIKDEHEYIREWALYHRTVGFDKIILYDDGSKRTYDNELGDLIRDGYVEMRRWQGNQWSRQTRAYNDFVRSVYWGNNDYCAFIDIDEFIFFDEAKSIAEFMRYYEEFAGVGLSWRLYNANGRIDSPNVPTPEAYTTEFDYFEPRIKVIGRLKDIAFFPSVHYFVPAHGRLVTTNNHTIYGMNDNFLNYSNGHIKHYFTKSWQDWVHRLKRGNITKGLRTVEMFFDFNPDLRPLQKYLTKDLNLNDFPTIESEDRIWDGEA